MKHCDKRCTKCKEVKPSESFGKRSSSKDGLDYRCKACNSAARKSYYEANPDKVKTYSKAYYEANSEKMKARTKAWGEANPDRYAAIAGRGNAIKRGGSLSDSYDLELCIPFYSESRRLTVETGIQHQVDHIVPLSKGGLHCQSNLQVLTAKENLEKRDNL